LYMYLARVERPLVTFVLIAVNVIVFSLTLLVDRFYMILPALGLVPVNLAAPANHVTLLHGIITLFSSMFIHDGILHILFNMWALLILGGDVERLLGRLRFIALYFASGVVGGLTYAFTSYYLPPNRFAPYTPAVGASGAIFGVMGAFGVFFPRRPLAVFIYLIPIVAPAYIVITALALIQTLLAFTMPFSTVAYTAHVGGLLMGLLMSRLWIPWLYRYRYYL